MEVNAFSLIPVSLGPQAKESGCVFAPFVAWQNKRRFPLWGTEGGSEECSEFFEPSHGARKIPNDER